MEEAKAKSFGVEVKSVRFIEDKNILELIYEGKMAKGCVFGDDRKRESFVKLFVIPCTYTLQIPYFKNIFGLKPKKPQTLIHIRIFTKPIVIKFVNLV